MIDVGLEHVGWMAAGKKREKLCLAMTLIARCTFFKGDWNFIIIGLCIYVDDLCAGMFGWRRFFYSDIFYHSLKLIICCFNDHHVHLKMHLGT